MDFKRIAVIGAGTMGSGIAGQIANAGQSVLLLDLPADDDPLGRVNAAKTRLKKSDPPALVHKSRIDLIEVGNIRDDFNLLAECDWVIEAVVERLDIKKALYKRLHNVISDECVVTSNTSTIPISLLVEDMAYDFRKRFAITHYFNPVRYMRLLELVRGEDTLPDVMERLARYNDEIMGKGVVQCNDTPGFLGNRVGVFAIQAGMYEAYSQGLSIEEADALMGRPMGIPKTGIFGLYDLIGIDLMSDVVDTLGNILPKQDDFHAVGNKGNPLSPLIHEMISNGYTGNKGKGGFYRDDNMVVDIQTGNIRSGQKKLPEIARIAAQAQANSQETLTIMISETGETAHVEFCKRFLARVFAYAGGLLPDITRSPQDIDDAMKLGFNWIRGPFEMMDAIGLDRVCELIKQANLTLPPAIEKAHENGSFYKVMNGSLTVLHCGNPLGMLPVKLPENTLRFNMMKPILTPIAQNAAASLYAYDNDLRILEFHSKANALTSATVDIINEATRNHGTGILVHNDAQHFSAGVDLNHFRSLIEAKNWLGIDHFLNDFQQAVKALKYTPVPVVGAPSGLSIGGGFEILAHCDVLVAHTNTVFGLVETGVGVVPSGGGVKETLWRWYQATQNWEKAAWNTWMQIGYANIGTSPDISSRFQYYLPNRDIEVLNRDKLIHIACEKIAEMATGYTPPPIPFFILPGAKLLSKMSDFMDKGINDGLFYPHDKTVAMQVASIVVNTQSDTILELSEQDLYDRERKAFLKLAKMPETFDRISNLLDNGEAIRN